MPLSTTQSTFIDIYPLVLSTKSFLNQIEHGRNRKKLSPSLGHLASRSLPEHEIPEGIDRETNPDGDGGDEVFAPDVKNGHAIRNEKSNGVKEKEDGVISYPLN